MRFVRLAIAFTASCMGLGAESINWASVGVPPMIGAPDGIATTLGGPFTLTGFNSPIAYPDVAAFLGLSSGMLAQGDVLGFDLNAGHSPVGGFESSRWVFDSLAPSGPLTVNYDETQPCGGSTFCIASGSILEAQYDAFFGTHGGGAVGFVLFRLPAEFDEVSPVFQITLLGGAAAKLPGEGTPDVDAVGVVSAAVPEPGTLGLIPVALLWCIVTKRVKPFIG